jgi:predicted metal-dependent hydrolase
MSSAFRDRVIVDAAREARRDSRNMEIRKNWLKLETPAGRTVKVLTHMHPRARRMSLTVGLGGPKLSTPRGTHPAQVKAFLRENADWLERQLRTLEKQGRKLAPPIPGVRVDEHAMTIALDLEHPEVRLIAQRVMRSFVVSQMKREVARLTKVFEPMLGRGIAGTRLLPLKSLWGSLSINGRMTLDLALMLAPTPALEYVVAHEMSHLWIRNHGRGFWRRVEAIYPDYHETRTWLSRQGYGVKAELARWIGSELT